MSLARLLRPRSVAVIGGGVWCASVVRECRKIGFKGELWPVHPSKQEISGVAAFPSVEALPAAPDATFIGVNREATIPVLRALAARGAGGAVCFASGFQEAEAEIAGGADLQAELVAAAGDMAILGPNCYGFLNALDGAALWPDRHGLLKAETGVAIITQSSNIALNITMQRRGLPLAYVVTVGNQAKTDLAEVGAALLEDPRVTALGMHVEGFGDPARMEALAATARRLGKPLVALKVGASEQARVATVSHTASLAGSDAGAKALMARLGIGRASSLPALLEALKLLHVAGPLPHAGIASMSCSGGEASLMADSALGTGVSFPPLSEPQKTALREALGPKVALANPLDYHTYIWGDGAAMARAFTAMMAPDHALGVVVLDFPRADRCGPSPDWQDAIDGAAAAGAAHGVPMAILATLPENLPEDVADAAMARGLIPFSGVAEALEAIAIAASLKAPAEAPLLPAGSLAATPQTLPEAEAKAALAAHGLDVPRSARAAAPDEAARRAEAWPAPLVLKGEGVAHKSEAGLVRLNLAPGDIRAAAEVMAAPGYLIEEQITGAVAELLVGVTRDPAHGFVLTLGAGGTLTELLRDSASLLLPATPVEIDAALASLRLAPLLDGYRGAPAADRPAIHRAIAAIEAYVVANASTLAEVEVNPLICTPTRAVAADALIRKADP
ncbi:acetate--CoA ligase family protein [Pseudoroseicyclus sp. CXY001]|uniref:acetate--CoA ligase family protein n=1 Tax=Pseudoroseicyclus sp. CXY001 TaxID=3242492 RepID=UPI00358DC00F